MKKNSKQLIFERMGLSTPKFTLQQEVDGDQPKQDSYISMLSDIYYQSGFFPISTPEGGIRFIQDDQEFDEFIRKVSSSWNEINLPF